MESKQSCGVCSKAAYDGACGKAFQLGCDFVRQMASRLDTIEDMLRISRLAAPAVKSEKTTQFGGVVRSGTRKGKKGGLGVGEPVVRLRSIPEEPVDSRVVELAEEVPSEEQLPTKMWTEVFKYLSCKDLCVVRSVRSQWRKIVDGERSLMDRFVLKFPPDIVIDRDFKFTPVLPASTILLKNATILAIGSWWFERITRTLVHLELSNCGITLLNLMEMLRNTPNLGSLILSCKSALTYTPPVERYSDFRLERMKSLTVDDEMDMEVLLVLLRMCPGLTHLKLSQELSAEQFSVINRVGSLEGISLKGSPDVFVGMKQSLEEVSLALTSEWFDFNENLINFSKSRTLLRSFDLNILDPTRAVEYYYPYVPFENLTLDDKTLTEVFQNLNLRRLSLRLRRIGGLSNSVIINLKHILNDLAELEYLAFDGVKEQSVSFSGATSPSLKELHLSNIIYDASTQFALHEFINGAKDLHAVTLADCELVSWSDLLGPKQVRKLRRLRLARVSTRVECELFECFDQLRYLEVLKCEMSAELLSILFRLCPRVEELHLAEMDHVGDAAVRLLCQKMGQLRKLTLRKCPITGKALGHIARHGRNLRHLTIAACGGAMSPDAKAKLDEARFFELNLE